MDGKRILIVEDESVPRLDLREMLEENGYVVVGEASDGLTALDLARELRPDLVIMDIMMPELDGIEASRVLAEERVAPVLLITAFNARELVARAKDAGAFGWVAKPYSEAHLIPQIEITLARYDEFTHLVKETGDARQALEVRKVVERAKGLLIASHGWTEAEAYRHLQRTSMNNRQPIGAVAEAVLQADAPAQGQEPSKSDPVLSPPPRAGEG